MKIYALMCGDFFMGFHSELTVDIQDVQLYTEKLKNEYEAHLYKMIGQTANCKVSKLNPSGNVVEIRAMPRFLELGSLPIES